VLQSTLEEFTQWQELTVGMWQRLSSAAEPVQWLAIHCYDRSGTLLHFPFEPSKFVLAAA